MSGVYVWLWLSFLIFVAFIVPLLKGKIVLYVDLYKSRIEDEIKDLALRKGAASSVLSELEAESADLARRIETTEAEAVTSSASLVKESELRLLETLRSREESLNVTMEALRSSALTGLYVEFLDRAVFLVREYLGMSSGVVGSEEMLSELSGIFEALHYSGKAGGK